jgi:hypothetical protein
MDKERRVERGGWLTSVECCLAHEEPLQYHRGQYSGEERLGSSHPREQYVGESLDGNTLRPGKLGQWRVVGGIEGEFHQSFLFKCNLVN